MEKRINVFLIIIGLILVVITITLNVQGYGVIFLLLGFAMAIFGMFDPHKNSLLKRLVLSVILAIIASLILWYAWWGIVSGFKM